MNTISFITANYVARESGYNVTEGWMQGDNAVNAYFRPLETFGERFDALLGQIGGLGFRAIDLWLAHLHWSWATEEHISTARALLQRHGMQVMSLAGNPGSTLDELHAACRLASALGVGVIAGPGGVLKADRAGAIAILKEHGVRLAIENHPAERTPADVLAQIGDGAGGTVGTAVDTGWWGTHGYDAARAIEELEEHILAVHLKDVLAVGGHDTCAFGKGVVPVEACVRTLQRIGYTGPLGIEHEPFSYDPSAEVAQMLRTTQGWLA